jgi:RNA polymerase sigma-70 factor (ECF subfamily)
MQEPENVCEESVFRNTYLTQVGRLRHFLLYKFGNVVQVEDLIQEAFVRLWENCRKVKPEKAHSFLFTVASNLYLNKAKHQKVVLAFQQKSNYSVVETEDPQFQLEQKEFSERLQASINALPENQRIVFLMNRIDKISYREIAELLGVSQKAVEKRMQKALLRLRVLSKKI